ncbi:MAG: 3-phosphoshikimate 1-carboxyvinyltransferase [Ruaniaceae bacterium]|nr:3-phosphoshikimate 1-carboxyvinyltransferase [Ruaniaceae bacterium]
MAAERLRGTLELAADKSIAHRALLFSAMGAGTAEITIREPGADVLSMAAAMGTLGAATRLEDRAGAHVYRVTGGSTAGTTARAALPGSAPTTLDCGNSGTMMRLLIGAATTRAGTTTLTGDSSLSARPMERVAAPLRSAGASIESTDGHAPVHISPTPITAHAHVLPVSSAQIVGALTLAAVAAPGTTTIVTPGPTRDHTERMLAWLGADIRREGTTTTLTGPTTWQNRDIDVPADPSGAAFWLVAGAIHPDAAITMPNVGLNPTRIGVIRVLERMGAKVESIAAATRGPEPAGDLVIRSGARLNAIHLGAEDVADVIDELPVLAIAMAAAEGTSTVRGASELRVKESDRIDLTVRGLRQLGIDVVEHPDGWDITGRPVDLAAAHSTPPTIHTEGDHRIAMAFAIADLAGVGACTVDDPACAAVSYPTFFDHLESLR